MKNSKHEAQIGLATLVLLAWWPDPASAANVEAGIGAGVGVSDNIRRTNVDPERETMNVADLELYLLQDTGRILADITSQLEYRHYVGNTYDDEWVGGVNAFVDLVLAENRFDWIIRENYGQKIVDPLAPVRPDNREDINFFATGPIINLVRTGRNLAQLELRYSNVHFEESPNNNSRYLGGLRFGREIRRNTTVSIAGTYESIEFDDEATSPDFDRSEAFLSYEIVGQANTLTVDAGYSQIDLEDETEDGLLARMTWIRELSAFANLKLVGGTRYSDQGNIFRFFQESLGHIGDTADIVTEPTPFRNNYFSANVSSDSGRSTTEFSVSWDQADYQAGSAEDRDVYRANLTLGRDFSTAVFGELRLGYKFRDYKYLPDRDTNVYSASVTGGYRFGPGFSVSVRYDYLNRNADTDDGDFDENRAFLRFVYTPSWAR